MKIERILREIELWLYLVEVEWLRRSILENALEHSVIWNESFSDKNALLAETCARAFDNAISYR